VENAVIVVVGADKPGIVAGISSKLAERNVNIIDISQTVVRGIFAMIMVVDKTNDKPRPFQGRGKCLKTLNTLKYRGI